MSNFLSHFIYIFIFSLHSCRFFFLLLSIRFNREPVCSVARARLQFVRNCIWRRASHICAATTNFCQISIFLSLFLSLAQSTFVHFWIVVTISFIALLFTVRKMKTHSFFLSVSLTRLLSIWCILIAFSFLSFTLHKRRMEKLVHLMISATHHVIAQLTHSYSSCSYRL